MMKKTFFVFMVVIIAQTLLPLVASAGPSTPTNLLLMERFEIEEHWSDRTTLFGVVNVDSLSSHEVTLRVYKENLTDNTFTKVLQYTKELQPNAVWTANLQDIGLPFDSDGTISGYLTLEGDSGHLIGDYFTIDPSEYFAQGDQLFDWSLSGDCVGRCDTFAIRYLIGGGFDGGTLLRIYHNASPWSTQDVRIVAYSEMGGDPVADITLSNVPNSHTLNVSDLGLPNNFGWLMVYLPAQGSVSAEYNALGMYSVGLRGWCLPDPPVVPPCVGARILVVSGDTVGEIGFPFYLNVRASGTYPTNITNTVLVAGLTRTNNSDGSVTFSGTPTGSGSFDVTSSNSCGSDTVTVIIGDGPPPDPPKCVSFSANPPEIDPGDMSTLSWNTVGATSAIIDNGIGNVPLPSGSVVVFPMETTTYTLSLVGPGGSDSCSAKVVLSGPPVGGEGCSPGYWKQAHHFDSWTLTGYNTDDMYNIEFGLNAPNNDPDNLNFIDTLWRGGGNYKSLGRHAVAALLNASHPGVNYDLTVSQVIAMVQNAFATGDYETAGETLAGLERNCSLN